MHGIQIAGRMETMVNRGWECAHGWVNAITPVHLASLGTCSEVAAHSFLLRSKSELCSEPGKPRFMETARYEMGHCRSNLVQAIRRTRLRG